MSSFLTLKLMPPDWIALPKQLASFPTCLSSIQARPANAHCSKARAHHGLQYATDPERFFSGTGSRRPAEVPAEYDARCTPTALQGPWNGRPSWRGAAIPHQHAGRNAFPGHSSVDAIFGHTPLLRAVQAAYRFHCDRGRTKPRQIHRQCTVSQLWKAR